MDIIRVITSKQLIEYLVCKDLLYGKFKEELHSFNYHILFRDVENLQTYKPVQVPSPLRTQQFKYSFIIVSSFAQKNIPSMTSIV